MSRLARGAAAAFGLAVLLGGLAVPVLGLVLADEPSSFCCGKGRCCCTGDAARGGDERDCLRRACGCGHGDAVVAGAPLRIEAVLPTAGLLADPGWQRLKGADDDGRLLDRPHAPRLPPPKRLLPA
jgi:hypothetical protein